MKPQVCNWGKKVCVEGEGSSHGKFLHPKLTTSTGFHVSSGNRLVVTISVAFTVHEIQTRKLYIHTFYTFKILTRVPLTGH